MKSDLIKNMKRTTIDISIIDPKAIYKEWKSNGIVETLLNIEEIRDL
jgi:hypothetical protein